MKNITNFELVDHGVEHEQYFQGCGISLTEFDHVVTGIGNDFTEALDDCLDQLACSDWETEGMEKRILQELTSKYKSSKVPEEGCYYYVSLRVR